MSVPSLQELAMRKALLDPATDLCKLPANSNGEFIGPRAVRKVIAAIRRNILSEIFEGLPGNYIATQELSTTYELIRELSLVPIPNQPALNWNQSLASVYREIRFKYFLRRLRVALGADPANPANERVLTAFNAHFSKSSSAHRTHSESFREVMRILDNMRETVDPAEQHRIPNLERLFELALLTNYWEGLSHLIELGRDPDIQSEGSTALHSAAFLNYPETIQALARAGADINARDRDGWAVLHRAARWNRLAALHALIVAGADLNIGDNNDRTALFIAAVEGYLEMFQMLLAAGADISVRNRNGETVLHIAVSKNFLKAVQALLVAGADINAADATGLTALHVAAFSTHPEAIGVLADRGAKLNVQDGARQTALHHAASHRHPETIKVLVDRGADLNIQDNNGETALHVAARRNSPEAVDVLVAGGADINVRNRNGETALHVAASRNYPEVIEALVARGADRSIQDNSGRTPAISALRNSSLSSVRALFPVTVNLGLVAITGSLLLLNMILEAESAQEDSGSIG